MFQRTGSKDVINMIFLHPVSVQALMSSNPPVVCSECGGKFGAIVVDSRCELCGQLRRLGELILSDRFPADGQPVIEPLVKGALFSAREVSDSYLRRQAEQEKKGGQVAPREGSKASGRVATPPKATKEKARGDEESTGGKKKERRNPGGKEKDDRSRRTERRRHRRRRREEEKSDSRSPRKEAASSSKRKRDPTEETAEEEESRSPSSRSERKKPKEKASGVAQPQTPPYPPGAAPKYGGHPRKEASSSEEIKRRKSKPPSQREGGWKGPIHAPANRPKTFRDHPNWDPAIKFTNKGRAKRLEQEKRREAKGHGKGSAWRGL